MKDLIIPERSVRQANGWKSQGSDRHRKGRTQRERLDKEEEHQNLAQMGGFNSVQFNYVSGPFFPQSRNKQQRQEEEKKISL